MKKRVLWVAGILALVAALWFLLDGGSAEDDFAFAPRSGDSPAFAASRAVVPPASSVLTAELPATTGSLAIAGRVVGPEGPVAGAVVVATVGFGEDVLSDLPCHCTPLCTRRLVECGCSHASLRVAELATSRRGEAPPVARAISDGEGAFLVTGLEPGGYALWAEVPGKLIGLERGVSAGDQNVEVEISEGMRLRGKVVDDEKKPFADAVVTAIYEEHARFFDAVSGPDGTFTIGPVPRGGFAVVASAPGKLPAHVSAGSHAPALRDLALFSPRVVSGRAVRDGEPVVGAEVTLEEGHRTLRETTDAQGSFRFERLRPGSYQLVAREGLSFAARRLSLEPGKDINDLVLELGPGGEIVGSVRSESGAPLADVELTAGPDGSDATTDPAGRFRIGPLGARTFVVTAETRGFLTERRKDVDVRVGSATNVDLVLRRAAPLRGVVVDVEGQPVSGADIRAKWRTSGSDGKFVLGTWGRAESKWDGIFEIDGLITGSFGLSVSHDDFCDHAVIVEAPRDDVRIVLERGFEVAGTVGDDSGEPISGALVSLDLEEEARERAGHGARKQQATDIRGDFRIRGVEKGRYVVLAMGRSARDVHRTLRMASATVDVHGEDTPPVKLQFKSGESIFGRVQTHGGEPVEGARVVALPEELRGHQRRSPDLDGQTYGRALSSADGSFEVRDLKPGKYELDASKDGFVGTRRGEELVTASTGDGAVSLVLDREGKVRGRVVDDDGKPIKHFTIRSRDYHDDGGLFELPVYREDEEELVFDAEGFATTNRRVAAKHGETTDLGDVVLNRGQPLSGTVLDATTNAPVPDVLVDLRDSAALGKPEKLLISVAAGAVKTGADGSFTLPRVDTSRSLGLFASHPSYLRWAQPLDPAAPRVVIKLDRGGTVIGKVLDVQGRPIARRSVVVHVGNVFKERMTGEDGSFEIRGLAFGAATVIAPSQGELRIPPQQTVIPTEGVARVELREDVGGMTIVVQLVGGVGEGRIPLLVPGTLPLPSSAKGFISTAMTGIEGSRLDGAEVTWEFSYVPPGPATLFVGEPRPRMRLSRHLLQVSEEPVQRFEVEVPETLTEIPGEW